MSSYILSVLGIVIAGILLDVIIPSGSINKYIKSIYSVFVVAVLINPLIKFATQSKDFTVNYNDYEINEKLLNFINKKQVENKEIGIETELKNNGFNNVDIIISFSIKDNNLSYTSCLVNLKDMVIEKNNQHINSYEFIKEVVVKHTNLAEEVIVIYEWKGEEIGL